MTKDVVNFGRFSSEYDTDDVYFLNGQWQFNSEEVSNLSFDDAVTTFSLPSISITTVAQTGVVSSAQPIQSNIVLGAAMSANSVYSFNHVSSNPDVPFWAKDRVGTDYILKNIKDAGMNTVVLHFNYSLDPNTDTFFRPTFNTESLYLGSPTWESLDIAGQRAVDAGLNPVFYMTIVQLPYTWEGIFTYTPKQTDDFFASYKQQLLKIAELSEKYDSPYMSIGVELGPVVRDAKYLPYWEDIISSVRSIYHGKLSYSSYVDDVHNFNTELDDLTFINLIDLIGINLFPETLDNGEMDGTYDQFYAEWKNDIVPGLQALADKIDKPIFISEFGITRLDGGGSHAFAGGVADGKAIDQKEQADVFDAALRAINEGLKTEGILIWGAADNFRSVSGKIDPAIGYTTNWVDMLAEDVISKWMLQFTNSHTIG